MPAVVRRSVSISRWKRNSSSMRDSAARPTRDRARAASPLSKLISALQDECHRVGEALPLLYLLTEGAAPLRGDLVEPRGAVVLRGLPRALDVAAVLEPLQCRVERALIYVEAAAGDLLNADTDPPSVHRRERQRLEDEEVNAAPKGIRLGRMARRHGGDLFSRSREEYSAATSRSQEESAGRGWCEIHCERATAHFCTDWLS